MTSRLELAMRISPVPVVSGRVAGAAAIQEVPPLHALNPQQGHREVLHVLLAHLAGPGALDAEPLDGAVRVRQRQLALARALQLDEGVAALRQLRHADPAHGLLLRYVLAAVDPWAAWWSRGYVVGDGGGGGSGRGRHDAERAAERVHPLEALGVGRVQQLRLLHVGGRGERLRAAHVVERGWFLLNWWWMWRRRRQSTVQRQRRRPGHHLGGAGAEQLGDGGLVALDGRRLEAPQRQQAPHRLPQHEGRRAQRRPAAWLARAGGRSGCAEDVAACLLSPPGGRRGDADAGLRRRSHREVICRQA